MNTIIKTLSFVMLMVLACVSSNTYAASVENSVKTEVKSIAKWGAVSLVSSLIAGVVAGITEKKDIIIKSLNEKL